MSAFFGAKETQFMQLISKTDNRPYMNVIFGNFYSPAFDNEEFVDKTMGLIRDLEKYPYLRLDRNIKGRYRLICDDKLWLYSQCSGNSDTLTLTTGEFMRVTLSMRRA